MSSSFKRVYCLEDHWLQLIIKIDLSKRTVVATHHFIDFKFIACIKKKSIDRTKIGPIPILELLTKNNSI